MWLFWLVKTLLVLLILLLSIGAVSGDFTTKKPEGLRRECGNYISHKETIPRYYCPLIDGPSEHTECCDPPEFLCCRAKRFFEIDQS